MSATLSLVIAARNCIERIEGSILPWKSIANEIIVVDQMSTDGTAEAAKRLGCKVIVNDPPNGNFDLNRKLGMQQAESDWIIYIDTDERPTPELIEELRLFLQNPPLDVVGARIPNIFYFLGHPLKHGIYRRRSAEIRLMHKGKWDYPCEAGFHRGVSVNGKVTSFKHAYKHFNVNTLSEWFIKTNQYTEHDAMVVSPLKETVPTYRAFFSAFTFFVRHYFFRFGFLDGFHGLVSVFYFMLYHLTLRIKIWEKITQRKLIEERDYLKSIQTVKR